MLNRINVKPSEINISGRLLGSSLRNTEKETIACNIIIISRKQGNEWQDFSFEEYSERCDHKATESERKVLDQFVKDRLLSFEDGRYSIKDAFVAELWKFVKI